MKSNSRGGLGMGGGYALPNDDGEEDMDGEGGDEGEDEEDGI